MNEPECDPPPPAHDEFIAEFARHSRRLYGYIRTLVPCQSDAEDVYQSTSLVMWNKFAAFVPGSNFFAWGCQIALFEIRKLRETQRRRRLLSDEALELLQTEFMSRDDSSPQRLDALAECIDMLAPTSRWLIEQRYYRERTPQDLAADLKRSVSSIYRSIASAHCWLLACVRGKIMEKA